MKSPNKRKGVGFIPHQDRVRQPNLTAASSSASEQQASSVIEVSSQSSWTRGSYVSSFIDGELGSTFGRWMRNAGRLVVDPIDNFIGKRELEKLYAYLSNLDAKGWRNMKDQFDAERYAPRLIEVVRYPVYPRKLRLLAQRITLELAIFGQIRFHQVVPRFHFHTKDEFQDSIRALSTLALTVLPKSTLLSLIPLTNEVDGFCSSLRTEIQGTTESEGWIDDDSLICRLIEVDAADGQWAGMEEVAHTLLRSRNETYWSLRRWARTQELHWESAQASSLDPSDGNVETRSSIGNLPTTYLSPHMLKEEEELEGKLITGRQRMLGEKLPSSLNGINLEVNYWNRGQRRIRGWDRARGDSFWRQ